MNQAQSLPTSLPYTQTTTNQQWIQQNTQRNLNIPVSSSLPSQVHGRQQLLPQQQQPQQPQMNQIRHGNLRPSHMQQQAQPPQPQHHPQSLLKQPIQQSFPQSSSSQQNSQSLPRNQFPTQRVSSSHQKQMVLPSQRQEQEQVINQLMNVPTSRPNNRDQQGAFRVSSSQQNNTVGLHAMAQQKNNLQSMTRGQQSQPMMSQQYRQQYPMQQQQPQNRNNTNLFQAAYSLRQTQNITDQQNQPQQLQRANPSSMFPLLLTCRCDIVFSSNNEYLCSFSRFYGKDGKCQSRGLAGGDLSEGIFTCLALRFLTSQLGFDFVFKHLNIFLFPADYKTERDAFSCSEFNAQKNCGKIAAGTSFYNLIFLLLEQGFVLMVFLSICFSILCCFWFNKPNVYRLNLFRRNRCKLSRLKS